MICCCREHSSSFGDFEELLEPRNFVPGSMALQCAMRYSSHIVAGGRRGRRRRGQSRSVARRSFECRADMALAFCHISAASGQGVLEVLQWRRRRGQCPVPGWRVLYSAPMSLREIT